MGTTLSAAAANRVDAVLRNFVRVQHAVFSVTFDATAEDRTVVQDAQELQ